MPKPTLGMLYIPHLRTEPGSTAEGPGAAIKGWQARAVCTSWMGAFLLALSGCCGCLPTPGDEPARTIEEQAERLGVVLPPEGVGPVKVSAVESSQTGYPSRQLIYFEWPDGTEEVQGRVYKRRKIITAERGTEPMVDLVYSREEGGKVVSFADKSADFGEFARQPVDLVLGSSWQSRDESEKRDCEVTGIQSFEFEGQTFGECSEIRCEIETTMPDGMVFQGPTVTLQCPTLGVVREVTESSKGEVTIRIRQELESLSWNGAAPPETASEPD